MAKRRKKTSRDIPAKGRLRDMADQLWSIAVRDDWNNCCAVCGASKCEAHHLIPRENEATRYDLRNGIALCVSHHKFDPAISPHLNAAGWLLWLNQEHPLRHKWYVASVENGVHHGFTGTKNWQHYVAVISDLKQYIPEDEYVRVLGVRFAEYLIKCETPG